MAAELLSFFRPAVAISGDWSSQEIAEFYRVEAALVQAGVRVFVDRGVTDEGDPWFVFCRETDGEVIVHFARINGNYLIAAESIGPPIRGSDFRNALAEFVAINPTLIPLPSARGAKLMLHPASLLAVVVATALYHMSGTEAVASSLDPVAVDAKHSPIHGSVSLETSGEVSVDTNRKWSDWQIAAVVGAMIALAATEYSDSTKETFFNLASKILDTTNDHIVLAHSVVADASPVPDLDGKVWTHGTLDLNDAHILFDISILSGGGLAVGQQLQIGSNDGLSQKLSTSATIQDSAAGDHWWTALIHGGNNAPQFLAWTDTSSSISSDANAKGADQLALVFPAPSGQGGPPPTSLVDLGHSNSAGGSSSPDHPVTTSETFDTQTAVVYVNSELNAANKIAPLISLSGNLSVQGVISHGASDVLGSALPSPVVEAAGHSDGSGGVPVATTVASASPVVGSTASPPQSTAPSLQGTTYEPFNAAAGEILDAFVRQNTFEVLTSNNNVVLFDTHAADFSGPDFISRTWSMSDGSTISIVGTVPHSLAASA